MVHSLHDEREAAGPVVAAAGQQPDAHGIAPGHQPIAVVLDLVNPVRARRRFVGGRTGGRVRRSRRGMLCRAILNTPKDRNRQNYSPKYTKFLGQGTLQPLTE